jgi:hypothetical protein
MCARLLIMPGDRALEPQRCRVGGLNQNYVSSAGTPCHIQIEDYGPVVDRASLQEVRRVNLIVYGNYGTPAARITYGHDFDYPDVRTAEYNQTIQQQMSQLVVQAQATIEQMEQRELTLLRTSLANRRSLSEAELRDEFEDCAQLYPTLFERALNEWRTKRAREEPPAAPVVPDEMPASPGLSPTETVYPEEQGPLRRVIEIESLIAKLGQDFMRLKAQGRADDLLLQRCRKLVDQARASISRGQTGDVHERLLEMTLDNLAKTWRHVRAQLDAAERGQ